MVISGTFCSGMKMSCWPSTSTRMTSLSTSGTEIRDEVWPAAVRTSAVQVSVLPAAASAELRRNERRSSNDVMQPPDTFPWSRYHNVTLPSHGAPRRLRRTAIADLRARPASGGKDRLAAAEGKVVRPPGSRSRGVRAAGSRRHRYRESLYTPSTLPQFRAHERFDHSPDLIPMRQ